MRLLKFAAIDIGTNAVRLLFSNVTEDGDQLTFKKASLVRVPVRLGYDVFHEGRIGEVRKQMLISTMHAFHHLINVHNVIDFRACATSAMREAENGDEIVEEVREKTGINIEVIDGQTEAEIIYANKIADMIDNTRSYLYVDVGGGSTEVTLFARKQVVMSYSFNIGTIRILKNRVRAVEYERMQSFLQKVRQDYPSVQIIGSGGNINKIAKLTGIKYMSPIPYREIRKVYEQILPYSMNERIRILGLNPDRADVIIPAAHIFMKVMQWSDAKSILVPKFGVADGIVRQLYYNYKQLTDA
jgi:exopolyphosphatase/guanosine-5'-triphosphate,3'-diphosphate pyrophosphatase